MNVDAKEERQDGDDDQAATHPAKSAEQTRRDAYEKENDVSGGTQPQ
jgi:hypothetical protein